MPRISYYVATSLDGFIAKPDGCIDWLSCVAMTGEDYGYAEFFQSTDGLLMGRTTFEHIQRIGPWPYEDKPCWVWAHRSLESKPVSVMATTAAPIAIVETAQDQGVDHLWLVGGGKLAAAFQAERLITAYIVSIIPIVLGSGIPLFDNSGFEEHLELKAMRSYKIRVGWCS
jgi:dihydrofolate reductase